MSDPVTNAEVEDVLSSIRRLVSEDKRPKPSQKPAVADRLVLTPALRVAEPPEADSDAWENDEPSQAISSDPSRDDQAPSFVDDEDNDVRNDDTAGMWRDEDAFDDDDDREVAWEQRPNAGDATLAEDAADAFEFSEDEDETDDHAAQRDHESHSDEDTSQYAASHGQDETSEEPDERAASAAAHQDATERDGKDTAALGAKIAALETAIGRIPDRWEPDGEDTGPYSGTDTAAAMAWEDDVELDATGTPVDDRAAFRRDLEEIEEAQMDAAQASRDDEEIGGIPFGNDDQFFDEETLRDLVSEIVRSELQGALGERITRNVRKLVRREIHRALTAQELE